MIGMDHIWIDTGCKATLWLSILANFFILYIVFKQAHHHVHKHNSFKKIKLLDSAEKDVGGSSRALPQKRRRAQLSTTNY